MKFNGQHLMKIVGFSKAMDGSTEWIVENSWSSEWGMDGYVKMVGGRGDTGIDMFSMAPSMIPYTMSDYYSMQNMQNISPDDLTGQNAEDEAETGEQMEDENMAKETNEEEAGTDEI